MSSKSSKYIIKVLNGARKNGTMTVVVAHKPSKVQGGFVERLGVLTINGDVKEGNVDVVRLGFWLTKGVKVTPKARWVVSMIFKSLC